MALDDVLSDLNDELIKNSRNYIDRYKSTPEIFKEIEDISKRMEQLHDKLNINGSEHFEKITTWKFQENWKPKKI